MITLVSVRSVDFDARDAEVGELDAAVAHDDDVGRLDVAVPDACACARTRSASSSCAMMLTMSRSSKRAPPRQVVAQAVALDVLHRDERVAARPRRTRTPTTMPGWFSAPAACASLLEAPGHATRRARRSFDQFLADGLDRDRALDDRIEARVDDAHRAFAEDAGDRVFAEALRVVHRGLAARQGLGLAGRPSTFQHLHRLHHARPHAARSIRASTPISSLDVRLNSGRRVRPGSRGRRTATASSPAGSPSSTASG